MESKKGFMRRNSNCGHLSVSSDHSPRSTYTDSHNLLSKASVHKSDELLSNVPMFFSFSYQMPYPRSVAPFGYNNPELTLQVNSTDAIKQMWHSIVCGLGEHRTSFMGKALIVSPHCLGGIEPSDA